MSYTVKRSAQDAHALWIRTGTSLLALGNTYFQPVDYSNLPEQSQ